MRKKLFACSIALAGLLFCSCGNKTDSSQAENDSIVGVILHDSIVAELDSMASIIGELSNDNDIATLIKKGNINLTEQQKKIKPDYLLTQSDIKDLKTLQEKYVAQAYLAVDQAVASLYGNDDDDFYSNSMARLQAETEAVNEKMAEEAKNKPLNAETVKQFYADMKKRNRLDKFYVAQAAYLIETLYVISHNVDLYASVLDDTAATNISKHLSTIMNGVDLISQSVPETQCVSDALQPLKSFNPKNASELKEQVTKLSNDFAEARKKLLDTH